MPTFDDPHAAARQATEALRGLAETTASLDDPRALSPLIGELQAATRSVTQVLRQLSHAHERHAVRALTKTGDLGGELALDAFDALQETAGYIEAAGPHLDRAADTTAQMVWPTEQPPERWISVVFLQGEEAEAVLEIIDRQGTDAAVEYLAGWDMADETEEDALENGYVYDAPPQSPNDRLATRDVYALTYNPDLGYVGLTRPMNVMPDPVLLHLVNPVPPPPVESEPPVAGPLVAASQAEGTRGRHRGPDREGGPSWFRPDAITDIEQSRGLSL